MLQIPPENTAADLLCVGKYGQTLGMTQEQSRPKGPSAKQNKSGKELGERRHNVLPFSSCVVLCGCARSSELHTRHSFTHSSGAYASPYLAPVGGLLAGSLHR